MNNGYMNQMGYNVGMGYNNGAEYNNGMLYNTLHYGQMGNINDGFRNLTMYNNANNKLVKQASFQRPMQVSLLSGKSKIACGAVRSEYKATKHQPKHFSNTLDRNSRTANVQTLSRKMTSDSALNLSTNNPGVKSREIGLGEKELLAHLKDNKFSKFFEKLENYDSRSKRHLWSVGTRANKRLLKCLKNEPVYMRSVVFGSLLGCEQYGSMILNVAIKNSNRHIATTILCIFKYMIGKIPSESYFNLFGAQISEHISTMGQNSWMIRAILDGDHKNYEDISDKTNKRLLKEVFRLIIDKEEKNLLGLFLDQCKHNVIAIATSYYVTFGMTVYHHAELCGIDPIIVFYLKQLTSSLICMDNYLMFLSKTMLESQECVCFLIYLIFILIETDRTNVFKLFESHYNVSFTTSLSENISHKSALKYLSSLVSESIVKTPKKPTKASSND